MLDIDIDEKSWNVADYSYLKSILMRAIRPIYIQLDNRTDYKLHVRNNPSGPMTLYDRTISGYTEIWLRTNQTAIHPKQITYQMSHEFCHVISNFRHLQSTTSRNGWFHEAICQLGSIYVLHTTGDPSDKDYLESDVAEVREASQEIQSMQQDEFNGWLRTTENKLRQSNASIGYERTLNSIVAMRLYPLFGLYPSTWSLVPNLPKSESLLKIYLREWMLNSPPDKRFLIDLISLSLLGESILN